MKKTQLFSRIFKSDRTFLFALLACIVALYAAYGGVDTPYAGSHLFHDLGDAFLGGHTYLKEEPNPAIAQLADPYDPVQNNPYREQDFSYYKGKYYVYFGPVPALLSIAVDFLTGIPAGDGILSFILAALGTGSLCALVASIARRNGLFRRWPLALALLAIAFGTWIPFLLRAPLFYETAIAGAYGFSALGALCLWFFLDKGKKYAAGLASLSFGLAVGCRSIHLGNIIIIMAACITMLRASKQPLFSRYSLSRLCWLLIPWLLCIAAFGIYNQVRFDSPFEIGARYVLTIIGNFNSPNFHFVQPRYALNQLYYYLFYPLPWKFPPGFPFFESSMWQAPWQTSAWKRVAWWQEPSYGLLVNSPFSLFYVAFSCDFWASRKWSRNSRSILRGLWIYSGALFAFLLVYFLSTMRYAVDFAPWMMALAGLYYLQLLQRCQNSPRWYRFWLWVGALAALYSIFTGAMAGYCSYSRCPR